MRSDPRPARRIKLSPHQYRVRTRAFVNKAKTCECGCGRCPHHCHHVVNRSQGGGDVPENWMALNTLCHEAFTTKHRVWGGTAYVEPADVAAGLRETMETRRLDVLAYVLAVKGQAWLDRFYVRK